MDMYHFGLLVAFLLAFYQTQAENFQQGFWREVFTVDVVVPGASLSTAAHTKNECILHCLQLKDCKTSAFHQHSATCWLYRSRVEYTPTGMASPGTRYFWRVSPSCPGELGYQLEAGICFKVYTTLVQWAKAGETCRNDGGHLVIADTVEKRNVVRIKANAGSWLGGSDKHKEGDWRWVDGTLVEPSNWSPGEPNNFFKMEHSLMLHIDGLFMDMTASAVGKTVCQIPLLQ